MFARQGMGVQGQQPDPGPGAQTWVGGARGGWVLRPHLGSGPKVVFLGGFPFGIFRLAQGDGSLMRAALMGDMSRTQGERRWQRDGMGGPGFAPLRASPGGPWLLATAPWHGRGHRWPP